MVVHAGDHSSREPKGEENCIFILSQNKIKNIIKPIDVAKDAK